MANRPVHAPNYSPETLVYIDWYNKWVPGWLYAGLSLLCISLGAYNFADRAIARWYTSKYHSLHRPPSGLSRGHAGKRKLEWLPSAILARWRTMSYRKNKVAGWFGLGSASQAVVIFAYLLLNLLIVLLGADGFEQPTVPWTIELTILGWIGWITGLSFDSLNAFHRWSGRLILVLASVHILGRIYVNEPFIDPSLPHQRYQAWGIAAYGFFALLILGSFRYVRIRWFKAWVMSHVALFFLGSLCLAFHRPQVSPYVVAAFVLYMSTESVSRGYGPAATIEILSSDTLRVSYTTGKRWVPGQHTFFHAPLLGAGGHPFSIASTFLPVAGRSRSLPAPESGTQTFIIRVRGGITRKLYEYALEHADHSPRSRDEGGKPLNASAFPTAPLYPCWTEGAYGHNLELHRYERVLLVTGGSGVTFALPLLLDLVRRIKAEKSGGKRITTKRLTWVWTVKETTHIDWIEDVLRDALSYAPPEWLDVRIHVTSTAKKRTSSLQETVVDVPISLQNSLDEKTRLGPGREGRTALGLTPAQAIRASVDMGQLDLRNLDGSGGAYPSSRRVSATGAPATRRESVLPMSTLARRISTAVTTSSDEDEKAGFSPNGSVYSPPTLSPGNMSPVDLSPVESESADFKQMKREAAGDIGNRPKAAGAFLDVQSVKSGRSTASWTTMSHHGYPVTIALYSGRPNIPEILDTVINESEYSDSISVGSCGPTAMTRGVAEAVASAIDPGKVARGEHRRNIALHLEEFSW